MLRNQDEELDQFGGIVQTIKYQNQDFNQEVTYQNKLLDNLNDNMERTHRRMVKVDNRLKMVIAKSNQKCLWFIIAIEVLIFVFIIIFF